VDAEHLEANRLNWDDRAALHASDTTGSYRIGKVMAGGSSLHQLETSEIGDLAGRSVIHLQCHIGLDTISLKHLGAAAVTGLDFSPEAIKAARSFAARAGADVRFVESDVMKAREALGSETFDMVYVTWGAINWIADISAWARVAASLLRPGGTLYLLEGHPQMNQLDARDGRLELAFDWRTPRDRPLVFDDAQTYTGDARPITHTRNYEWIHPVSDVVNALVQAGLTLDFLREHDIVVWKAFPFVEEVGEDQFALPEGQVKVPMSYSVGATKRG
jgi:SAM-dependent methyltransferase